MPTLPATLEEALFRVAIQYHLKDNHYPSLPLNLTDACIQAIHYADGGEWGALIELPNGNFVTAQQVVEYCRLDYFIKSEEE